MTQKIRQLTIIFPLILLFFTILTQSFAQSTVNLDAVVPPKPSDLQNDLVSITQGNTFAQGAEIVYEVSYGNNTLSQQDLTLQASWSLGTFESGVNAPSAEVLSYIIGSATDGYNTTAPVVDLTNRTITWTITNFPASTTDQTVEFRLRTTSNYAGNARASYQIQSVLTVTSTIITDSITNQSYLYNYDPDSYNKSLTPAPTGTPTPTPTPPPDASFNYVITPEIRSDRVKIEFNTNIHTTAILRYGTSPDKLSSFLESSTPRIYHFFTLDNLNPETEYFFQIEIQDAYRDGKIIKSDIFSFKTALVSDVPELNLDSVIFTSNNTILFDGITAEESEDRIIIIIPTNTPFEFKFALKDKKSVKTILLVIRDAALTQNPVLGINSFSKKPVPNSNYAQIVEIQKGVYVGRLLTADVPRLTDVFIQISDFNGNVIEHKIGTIKSVKPLKIVNKKSKKPLENAKVILSLFNPTTRIFQEISPQVIPINNPAYSDSQGLIDIVLPSGKYRAEISLVKYENQSVEFTIGPYENEEYPVVELVEKPFALLEIIKYYLEILFDLKEFTSLYTNTLTASGRMYDLLRLFAFSLLGITVVGVFLKTIWNLFHNIIYPWHKRARDSQVKYVQALVSDTKTHKPIHHAHVYLIDLTKDKIIARSFTNRFGYATFHIMQPKKFRLTVLKKGYETQGFYDFKRDEFDSTLSLWMKRYEKRHSNSILQLLANLIQTTSLFIFELAMAIIVILEILFIQSFGIQSVLPIILVTLGTIILLLFERLLFTRKRKTSV